MRYIAFLLPLLLLSACEQKERAPRITGSVNSGGAGGGDAVDEPIDDCDEIPELDTSRLCGEHVVPVVQKRPTLYFVVDVSGSMNDHVGSTSKLEAAQDALTGVVAELGHRVNYGLTTFPGPSPADPQTNDYPLGCEAGVEVFPVQAGDPLVCRNKRGGPVLDAFTDVVGGLVADGGTPLSPTLDSLELNLSPDEGQAVVVLMTDGAPNCNPVASCDIDQCMSNLEGAWLADDRYCDASYNCCDAATMLDEDVARFLIPELYCVDTDDSVEAVNELAAQGVKTYVIGVPGSELYADTMNRLAEAGGTTQGEKQSYYDVSDLDELTSTLLQIGSEIAQSCMISLDAAPTEPDLINVYFDGEVAEADATEGWSLDGDTITFQGVSCDAIRTGEVMQVQVVSGCLTVIK